MKRKREEEEKKKRKKRRRYENHVFVWKLGICMEMYGFL